MEIALTLNGEPIQARVQPNELLLDFVRERYGLTGAKRSCDLQICGTCTMLVDGLPLSACCTLAADVDGATLLTIEGLARLPEFARFERAFSKHAALQCGFCTSGMLLTLKSLLDARALPSDPASVKQALAGNLCRCTGYRSIVSAAIELAQDRQ